MQQLPPQALLRLQTSHFLPNKLVPCQSSSGVSVSVPKRTRCFAKPVQNDPIPESIGTPKKPEPTRAALVAPNCLPRRPSLTLVAAGHRFMLRPTTIESPILKITLWV